MKSKFKITTIIYMLFFFSWKSQKFVGSKCFWSKIKMLKIYPRGQTSCNPWINSYDTLLTFLIKTIIIFADTETQQVHYWAKASKGSILFSVEKKELLKPKLLNIMAFSYICQFCGNNTSCNALTITALYQQRVY